LLLLALFLGSSCAQTKGAKDSHWKTDDHIIFLHRGARLEAPEGTLANLAATVRQGACGIEVDLRRTLDGVIVNYHDKDTFMRGRGLRRVEEMSFAEFRELDMGAWFGKAFEGSKGVSFEEILRFCKANTLLLRVDLKTPGIKAEVEELFQRYEAWPLMASSVDGAFRDKESVKLPWLAKHLWRRGVEGNPKATSRLIKNHKGPFQVNVDDARVLAQLLGRHPERRELKAMVAKRPPPPPAPLAFAALKRTFATASLPDSKAAALMMIQHHPEKARPFLLSSQHPAALWSLPALKLGVALEAKVLGFFRAAFAHPKLLNEAWSLAGRTGNTTLARRLPIVKLTPAICWAASRLPSVVSNKALEKVIQQCLANPEDPDLLPTAQHAVLALAARNHVSPSKIYLQCLSGPKPLALCAVAALGDLHSKDSLVVLGNVLASDTAASLPGWAINELCVQLARCGQDAIPHFIGVLNRNEPAISREVVFTLARMNAQDALKDALKGPFLSPAGQVRARTALKFSGP